MIPKLALRTLYYSICVVLLAGLFGGCSQSNKAEPVTLISTPTTPEIALLERAMLNYDRERYSIAREAWAELRDGYPNSYYSALAEIKIADSYFYAESYTEALVAYEEFIRLHPGHESIAYVYYQIANSHLEQYRGVDRDQTPLLSAIAAFEKLKKAFPSSLYTAFAKEKSASCRELLAEYEAYVANFYRKQGLLEASARRYRALEERYPESEVRTVAKTEISSFTALEQMMINKAIASAQVPEHLVNGLTPETPQLLYPQPRNIPANHRSDQPPTPPSNTTVKHQR